LCKLGPGTVPSVTLAKNKKKNYTHALKQILHDMTVARWLFQKASKFRPLIGSGSYLMMAPHQKLKKQIVFKCFLANIKWFELLFSSKEMKIKITENGYRPHPSKWIFH